MSVPGSGTVRFCRCFGFLAVFIATLLVAEGGNAEARLNAEDFGLITVDAAAAFFGAERLPAGAEGRGGYSGLLVSESGDRLLAVSDHGHWLQLRPLYRSGRLAGLGEIGSGPLLDLSGVPVSETLRDAEALAAAPDGGVVVAFERQHRLWRYKDMDSPRDVAELTAPEALSDLPDNAGLEAATLLCDGRLLLIAQRAAEAASAWSGHPGAWRTFDYRYDEDWQPTGATTLPDCQVAVLERRKTKKKDKAANARILVLSRETLASEALTRRDWRAGELLRLTLPKRLGQFESIAARPAADGGAWLYMLSDNDAREDRDSVLLLLRYDKTALDAKR